MQDLADKVSAIITLLLPLVTAFAGWAGASLKKVKKKDEENAAEMKALKDGVKGLLRKEIIDTGMHYIEKGYIPPYGIETLKGCHTPYIILGDGDPAVAHVMHKCEELEVRSANS